MEMTWDNLGKLFVACSERAVHRRPHVSWKDTSMTIDGDITREFFDKFIAEHDQA